MEHTSLHDFYREIDASIPADINKEIGHFNVFHIEDIMSHARKNPKAPMPYNRRAYYKISLIKGRNKAEYADKVIEIEKNALLFAAPHSVSLATEGRKSIWRILHFHSRILTAEQNRCSH